MNQPLQPVGGNPATVRHYGSGRRNQLTHALNEAGLGTDHVDWRALASLDQFHVGGLAVTKELPSASTWIPLFASSTSGADWATPRAAWQRLTAAMS